jgi:predicted deacylase
MFIYDTEDTELREKMIQMASCFDCLFIETTKISGNTGEAVKEFKIPCIMTESGTPYPIREKDVQYHVNGILNLLKHLGMMKGKPSVKTPLIDPTTRRLWAQTGGAWRRNVEAGQHVNASELLGTVSNLKGETLQTVIAPFSGVVSFLRTHYSVNEGDTLLWLAEV